MVLDKVQVPHWLHLQQGSSNCITALLRKECGKGCMIGQPGCKDVPSLPFVQKSGLRNMKAHLQDIFHLFLFNEGYAQRTAHLMTSCTCWLFIKLNYMTIIDMSSWLMSQQSLSPRRPG